MCSRMKNEAAVAILKCMLIDIRQNLSDSIVKKSPWADVLTQRKEAIETALKALGTMQRSNMRVFCFTCGNDEAQVVATKGEYNLVECTKCGCRWRRSLDPLYERTALVEVDIEERREEDG